MKNLHWNTVSPLLKEILIDLMQEEIFSSFRLVGGTALSLQIGHRMSVDIDLFTDADYGSIDFDRIKNFLKNKYAFYSSSPIDIVAFANLKMVSSEVFIYPDSIRLIWEYSKDDNAASFSIDKPLDRLINLNWFPNFIIGSISTSLRTKQIKVYKMKNIIAHHAILNF